MEEIIFLKKMEWCAAEMVELTKGQGVDGIEYKMVYKDLQGQFFRVETTIKLIDGDVDVQAEQASYSKEVLKFKEKHPSRRAIALNPKLR